MFISECFTGKMGLLSQTGQIYGKSHLFAIHSTNCSVEGCCAWSLPPRAQQHRGISDIHWGEERERERERVAFGHVKIKPGMSTLARTFFNHFALFGGIFPP